MAQRLAIEDVALLLKTGVAVVEGLVAEGRLHGVTRDGQWSTTPEILECDLELLTETARIERLRAGIVPVLPAREEAPVWLTRDWVAASLTRVRAAARDE
jgi:hypothetical protein